MAGRPVAGEAPVRQILLLALLLAGCAGSALDKSEDFDRHRYSRLIQPYERPGQIYFDVIFSTTYPSGDAAADQVRTRWLEAWLAQRRLCAEGHEVALRRPFEYLEDNPAGYQERWEVRCRPATGR